MSQSNYLPPDCTILITGCSSGIGLYCALQLKQLNFNVIASARKIEDVQRLEELGLKAVQIDLNSESSVNLGLNKVLELTNERLDVLFNNAAFGQPGAVEDLSRETLRHQFETNVFGTQSLTNLVIKTMRKQGHGKIIQNSSVLGLVSLAFRGAYNASKHALEALTDTLRLELHGTGIQVSLIEPGPIESEFRKNAYRKFLENIDRTNSPWHGAYQAVEQRLASETPKKDPFTLGPEAVFNKVMRILKAKHPKPRYYVTFPTYLFGTLKRVLSARALDLVLRRVMSNELNTKENNQRCG